MCWGTAATVREPPLCPRGSCALCCARGLAEAARASAHSVYGALHTGAYGDARGYISNVHTYAYTHTYTQQRVGWVAGGTAAPPYICPLLSQPPPLAAPPLISGCRVCCVWAWRGLPGAALGYLANDNPANQQAIAAAGGVEAVLGAMRAHPEAERVQEWGCFGA